MEYQKRCGSMMKLSTRRVILIIICASLIGLQNSDLDFINMVRLFGVTLEQRVTKIVADVVSDMTVDEVTQTRQLSGRPLEEISQDDLQLVEFIRRRMLVAPSSKPYNLSRPDKRDFSQDGQTATLLKLMGSKYDHKPGFFVECGGFDGEEYSNTLYFEREGGWSGLLIEANPANFRSLLSKNRHVYAMQGCLSTTPHPMVTEVVEAGGQSGISEHWTKFNQKRTEKATRYTVLCVPLYSALLALNTTTVDYFSLDVEGAELPILKTIPFDKLDIRLLTAEYSNHPYSSKQHQLDRERTRKNEINNFFSEMKNPRYETTVPGPCDLFFIKTAQ